MRRFERMKKDRKRGERRLPETGIDDTMAPPLSHWTEILEQEFGLARASRRKQRKGMRKFVSEKLVGLLGEVAPWKMPGVRCHVASFILIHIYIQYQIK